ncbi:hypothetical protein ANCDUO_16300 [Ancylostoma duodenale]|uniref:Uncharacterized protein n=1 Tax=Ancylostoma duodenale TaxID=51022 RepID=A0A0C2CUR3_9BILA|nr:hypothetical protein ANCDUO_16300 [Ancylostoma duodenale]
MCKQTSALCSRKLRRPKKIPPARSGPTIIPGEEYFLFRNVNQRSRSSRKTRSLQLSRISHEPEVSSGARPGGKSPRAQLIVFLPLPAKDSVVAAKSRLCV